MKKGLGVLVPFQKRVRSGALLLALAAAVCAASLRAAQAPLQITPGPREMTAEEKSLAADPAGGGQHGIVLADETIRDDRTGRGSTWGMTVTHRFRAKIFSNEGRSMADVEVPVSPDTEVLKWWAWTVLPDGTVQEVRKPDLREQVLEQVYRWKVSVLKAALPAVSPGCVIEYGYVLREHFVDWQLRIELQGPQPVRRFWYQWIPMLGRVATVRISRGENLPLKLSSDPSAILITGNDLPAVVEEPFMPPLKEVRAAATLYYRSASDRPEEFWTREAKRVASRAAVFGRDKPLKSALAGMNLPAGDDLGARLRAVYDWLGAHVKRKSFLSAEEVEEQDPQEEGDRPGLFAQDVLERGEATGQQMDFLFLGFARVLGVEAYRVAATNRTDHYFDPALLSVAQFNFGLVAVRLPGDPPDRFTFVMTGSGLPYGEIPWWIAGSMGFLADPKAGRPVPLEPSNPVKNFSETNASLSFDVAEGTAQVRWSRSDSGQAGLFERLTLRSESPERRRKALEELCGAGETFEVTRAEAPGLDDLNRGLQLECEGSLALPDLSRREERYSLRVNGVWEEPVPELTAAFRVHPVVFPFPRSDRNVIDVAAPPGYATESPPTVNPIESPYGRYALFITANPQGYHLERIFSLATSTVPATEYAPLRSFLQRVHQADRTSLEFRRSE